VKKFIFALLFIAPSYGFAQGSVAEEIQNILNDNTEEPSVRFHTALTKSLQSINNLSFEEASPLCDILYRFANEEIKDDRKRNMAKAYVYNILFEIFKKRATPGDHLNMEISMKRAVEYADSSGDPGTRARMYEVYGHILSKNGKTALAHEYLYKAISLYESLNDYDGIFRCFLFIATDLGLTQNIPAMQKVIVQMQQYTERPGFELTPFNKYAFYSVKNIYYNHLSENNPENIAYKDSELATIEKVVDLVKNNEIEFSNSFNNSLIGFQYYKLALAHSKSLPRQYDSIHYFLDQALLESKSDKGTLNVELEICVYILRAKVRFEQKQYEQSKKDIYHALSLLEGLPINSAIDDFSEVYSFLVKYYETMNRPTEALKYHKLLLETQWRLFNRDKMIAMTDMLVKHETEKKQEQIDRLAERHKNHRRILTLTICLIVALLVVVWVLIRLNKSRKKNFDLSIYEAALLSELKHNELEQTEKEKERLQQQYDGLKTQAERNKQKALSYDAELKRIKQQLEQKPTKTMIGKLRNWISESYMEQAKKDTYITRLSELDVDMLEQGYLTTNEKISNMDMKYIICFAIDMDTKDMSYLFNVEPTSIRSVRYRIKKKFGGKNTFKFLM